MPVRFTFTSGLIELPPEAIKEFALGFLPDDAAMLYAANRQITRIRTRTQQGVDVDGRQFTPYSKDYAKYRRKHGRNETPVDLTFTGRMFGSMQAAVETPRSFSITVTDPNAAIYGKAHNEGNDRQPERRFFDTSDPELEQMQKDLVEFGPASKP